MPDDSARPPWATELQRPDETLAQDWTVALPAPATDYFFRNGDSFQGPLTEGGLFQRGDA